MITITAKIYISDTEIIEIDRRNMLSVSRSIFDRSDLKLPSFGIISNKGNIEFNDSDGKVLHYAENLQLQKGQKCEIWLNNTLVENASELIGSFETDQWDYDNDNRLVSVSLKDDLEEWQEINIDGFSLQTQKRLDELYIILYEKTPSKYNMLAFSDLDETTQGILSNTYIQYPFLENGSLWQQWNKLCQVAQAHIYKNNDGYAVFFYNGGN